MLERAVDEQLTGKKKGRQSPPHGNPDDPAPRETARAPSHSAS
jgi:hypothetical protein